MYDQPAGALVGSLVPGANTLAAQVQAKPMSQVDAAFDAHERGLDTLNALVSELESRLSPVLSPVNQADGIREATPVPPMSPVVHRVASQTDSVDMAARRLRTLLDNLEV